MMTTRAPRFAAVLALACVSVGAGAAHAQCSPGWTAVPPDGPPGEVNSLLQFDDGTGPALYAAGNFVAAPGGSPNIARLRNGAWEPAGAGRPGEILDLLAFTTGGAPRLYTAGFSGAFPGENMSRWENTGWSWFHTPGSWIGAAASFDAGTGARMIVSGSIIIEGSLPFLGYIAQWDGAAWTHVGGGVDTIIWDFVEHDDGRGRALFAIGDLHTAGTLTVNGVARWDGQAWSTLGSGFNAGLSSSGRGRCGLVYDDGSGPALFVGGIFTNPGGVPCRNIAKWTGTTWQPLAAGVGDGSPNFANVNALAAFDDGGGTGLVAAGTFTTAGGQPAAHIAMWRGGQWLTLGSGINGPVNALAVIDLDRSGPQAASLVAGGLFTSAGGIPSANVAVYRSCACYANCDRSSQPPVLNVLDFNCFLSRFAAADPYANCDGSSAPPALNVLDFNCFLGRFAAGCP
jgi:hypothetical protein